MIFPMGSTFIFGSWVYEADDEGNLHGRLIEAPEAHEDLTLPTGLAKDLTERFSVLMMPESTQAPTTTDLNLVSGLDSSSEFNPGSFGIEPSSFLIGLWNAASTSKKLGHLPRAGLDSKFLAK
jgi:hypothetical protein